MAVDVVMPRLSDSMEEGTVARWLVAVGEDVARGQPLVEIDTDKATMEYEAEEAGTLLAILVPEGDTAAIGAPIARIGAPGETAAAAAPVPAVASAAAAPAPAPVAAPAPARAERPAGGRENASPVARRLARELGVDLATLAGTGPGGAITKADVEHAAQGGAAAESAGGGTRLVEPSRIQRTVARRMVEGHAAPDFAVEVEIDMTAALALREEVGASPDTKPSINDLVVKAVALALRDAPRLNGTYTDAGFELHDRINVGIAVATEDALLVPTIFDADSKPLAEIAREARELAGKVREGKIGIAELEGGTFTVTNLGMFGVRRFFPILNPPQACILAVGDAARRPVVDEQGEIVARAVMSAILVCDHRIVYGADAARFMAAVRDSLEHPDRLA